MKYAWVVEHPIPLNASIVFEHLDERLFNELQPPTWLAEIKRNDGVEVGNEIWVQLHFPISGLWKTIIVERKETAPFFFVDESTVQLPSGMRYWKHIHRVVPVTEHSCKIEEDVQWESSNRLIGFVLNLGFWFMMKDRRKTYQKYFEKIALGVDRK